MSETVVDQFLQHTKHLKSLSIGGENELSENERQNVIELANLFLENQEEQIIQKLHLSGLSSRSFDEPTEQDKRLINNVISSGLTQLTTIGLCNNKTWFRHNEV